MATLKAIADGTTYTLTGGAITYRMIMQNTGMAPVRTLTQRGPLQDGVTATGYRLDPRTIRITFMFQAASLSGADDRRSTIYNIFRPRAELMTLEETLDNGNVRRIDGRVTGAMDMPVTPLQDRIGVSQIFTVDFFCPDPTWYNPTASTTTFSEADAPVDAEAAGTISAVNVLENTTDPTQGQNWTAATVTNTNPWSIVWKTNITDTTPAAEEFAFATADNTYYTLLTNGDANVVIGNGGNSFSTYVQSGSHVYMLICDGSDYYLYIDNVQKITAIRSSALSGTRKWRSNTSGTSPWTPGLDNAIVYDIALTSTQRTALQTVLASASFSTAKTINNAGNHPSFPTISITGPITDAVLTNVTTGEDLDFTGITIAGGDTRVIDCRYGYKTVKNAAGTNKIADLTAASDLATFHLEPGDNAFTLVGTGTDANTQVTVRFNPRHIGI